MRQLLGACRGAQAAQLEFSYNEYRKPAVKALHGRDIQFNLAHSGDYAVYAFALQRAVGIDLEKIGPMEGIDQIMKDYFSALEQELVNVNNG